MRLSGLVPSISAELVDHLESLNIRTETDLLFSSTADMVKRLPHSGITASELEATKRIICEQCSSPGLSAFHSLETKLAPQELSTGREPLDRILDGLSGLVQISGDRESGKTLFCLNIVLRQLAFREVTNVLWIDTTGSFSADIARQIVESTRMELSVLERLKISVAFDIETAQGLLEEIYQCYPKLLVIDTITPLFAPLLSATSAQGHAVMSEFMGQLRLYAQAQDATILVVNNTARQGPETTARKPALGPSFGLLTDSTLWLQKIPSDSKLNYSATLIGSSYRSNLPIFNFKLRPL
ncbi:P-loop containing nucleoside triphosphate hydrolase protein [Crepidotus variabilis]|uniref:P-loop containing nucleoside triphosphate hydrolase protein n=1 Tax=Crepidotus variabilis TaxID=179855 RepID=A0A9P6E4G3_9AGAR|nr:P-loop containing nucleoside triphosphate hydrolase protein [Crepidotus variabilis]